MTTENSWIYLISQSNKLHHSCIVLLLGILICSTGASLYGNDDAAEMEQSPPYQVLQVGTRHAPPFTYRDDNGEWRGLSITLLNHLADELGFTYQLQERSSMQDLLQETAAAELDMAVAAITITPERERRLDFSHPFHFTGLGLAVPYNDQQASWMVVVTSLLSPAFLSVVISLSLVLLVTGGLLWLAERNHNPQFPSEPLSGLGSGFWWSAVTMTTVGYGDKAPVTLKGRIVALIWMFAALIMIASFTAQITSSLTLSAFNPRIAGPEDLTRARVGVVSNTTAYHYAVDRNLRTYDFPALQAALQQLEEGAIDVVIHDHPLLSFEVQKRDKSALMVMDRTFERQDYGIALPLGSPWRKTINPSLINKVTDPDWGRELQGYGLR